MIEYLVEPKLFLVENQVLFLILEWLVEIFLSLAAVYKGDQGEDNGER